jgi:hypothetical protein
VSIELPDLVQRVRVDASDMAAAERRLRRAGDAYEESAESVERLDEAQDDAAESSEKLGTQLRDTGREATRASGAHRRLADNVRAVRAATDSTRKSVAASVDSADELRLSELRLSLAQKQVERAQSRLNRLRDEGKQGTDEYVRSEINVIDALRRVAREQDLAAKAANRTSVQLDGANASLVRFTREARRAGDGTSLLAHGIKLLKVPAIVTAAGLAASGLGALGVGAVALTSQLVGGAASLSGALAAIPAGLIAIASTKGVFKAITSEAGEAAEAIRKYGRDSDQAKEALKALSPEARAFALDLENLIGRFETIRRAGQAAALPGFSEALERARTLLPVVEQGFVGISRSLASVATRAAGAFTGPAFRRDLGIIASRNSELVRVLGRSAINLAVALKGVVLAAGPMVEVFARAGKELTGQARSFTQSAEGQEKMSRFFERTTTNVFRLVASLRDLTVGLINFGRTGQRALGIDFVGGIESAIKKFRAFTESTRGQSSIAKFFADARPVLIETGRLLLDITKAFGTLATSSDLAPVISQIRTELLPAILELTQSVGSRLGPILVDLATAFIKFNNVLSFSPIIEVAGALAKLTIVLSDLIASVPGLSTFVASLIAMKVALTGLAVAGKITGITGLASAFINAGTAAGASSRGFTGFLSGLRGVDSAAGTTASKMNGLGGAIRSAFTGRNGAGTAVSRLGSLRTAIGGISTALGGPWTLAIGAAAGAVGYWAMKNQEAKARIEELTAAIANDTGVVGANTRAYAANRLEKSGALEDAQKLGIDLDTLTDAYLGNRDAIKAVNTVVAEQDVFMRRTYGSKVLDYVQGLSDLEQAAVGVRDAVRQGNGDLPKAIDAYQRQKEAAGQSTDALVGLAGATTALAPPTLTVRNVTEQQRRSFIRAAIEAGNTRVEARRLARQLGLLAAESPVEVDVKVEGIDPAIQRIADLRYALEGIPQSVTVGVLNKIGGAGGALGEAPSTPPTPTSPRVAERAALTRQREQRRASQPEELKIPDYTAGATAAAEDAGAEAGRAAGSSFSNEFVKTAGGDLTRAGQRLVENLVKALTGGQDRIRETAGNLRELIRGAFSGATEDRLLARVKTVNQRLLELARQRDDIAQRIRDSRREVIEGAQQAGEGLRDDIIGSGNPVESGVDGRTNILRIIGNLRTKVAAAKKFARHLRELRARGINADTLRQLIEAGPEAGGPAAEALARASDEQLAEVNSLQGQLRGTGEKAGAFAEKQLEKVGLDAISGLLKGLRSRRSEIEAEMLRIARSMRDSIRKALGIRSPSTVMANDVSDPAADGIIVQLRKRRRDIAAAAAEMGRAMVPTVPNAPVVDLTQRIAATPRAGDVGALPQRTAVTKGGDKIGNVFHIGLIEMVTTNPKPEPLAEVTAPENLRKVAASLSR